MYQNITYGYYFIAKVPYLLYLIYFSKTLVIISAISTSHKHILNAIFNISSLDLHTYIFNVTDSLEYIAMFHIQNLYTKVKLLYCKDIFLTKEQYVFKCIHCNRFCENLPITYNICVVYLYIMQIDNQYVR